MATRLPWDITICHGRCENEDVVNRSSTDAVCTWYSVARLRRWHGRFR